MPMPFLIKLPTKYKNVDKGHSAPIKITTAKTGRETILIIVTSLFIEVAFNLLAWQYKGTGEATQFGSK